MTGPLVLALPSKGRLMQDSEALLARSMIWQSAKE